MPRSLTVRTLAELGPGFILFGYCRRCYRSGRNFSVAHAMMRYGRDAELEAIRRRLRCSKCGSRDCRLYRAWDAGPPGFRE